MEEESVEITWFRGPGLRVVSSTWQKAHAKMHFLGAVFSAFRPCPAVYLSVGVRRLGKLCGLGLGILVLPGSKPSSECLSRKQVSVLSDSPRSLPSCWGQRLWKSHDLEAPALRALSSIFATYFLTFVPILPLCWWSFHLILLSNQVISVSYK
jgi:hypothetical protein